MNIINSDDVLAVIRSFGKLVIKVPPIFRNDSVSKKIADHWDLIIHEADSWYSIPAVQQRWNRLISGCIHTDHRTWTANYVLKGKSQLTMLSLGCGTGHAEIAWAKTGLFSRIEGWDISNIRIEIARRSASEANLNCVTQFENRDLLKSEIPHEQYDVILFEHSLHHFYPINKILDKIQQWMKPEGWLIINEYVGPNRFQWSKVQIQEINSLLRDIPESCRTLPNGKLKTRILAPSLLRMWLTDPSEAADSASILTEIKKRFIPVEEKHWGGTILHPLLHQISRHFRNENNGCNHTLIELFEREDELLENGIIESDFCFGIYRNKI
jgi:ubiquinone/menaquinone biosynthesis C-methylase UbiE